MNYREGVLPSQCFPDVISWGAGPEASVIIWGTNIKRSLQDTFSIGLAKNDPFSEIRKVKEECSTTGWDGYDAEPISEWVKDRAYSFLGALPLGTESPTIGAEPDGCITFEWYRSPRWLLSVSVGSDCLLHYAALMSERKAYGTEPFLNSVPEIIISLISQVTI